MTRFARSAALAFALGFLLAGCGNNSESGTAKPGPVGVVPSTSPTSSLPTGHPALPGMHEPGQAAPSALNVGAVLTWTAPASWKSEPPSSNMRRAQYRVPHAEGDTEDAECAVFAGIGGGVKENAAMWVGQFTPPDGTAPEQASKIEARSVNGREITFVEAKGAYAAAMGGAGAGPKTGFALYAAIVPGPDGLWFFKMVGPQKTIEARRGEFETLIGSIPSKP